eukprot:5525588-Heterocapsa_arctica.AAC.1
MIAVRYVGHHARTGKVIGLTDEGVKFGQVANRLPSGERWNFDGSENVKGLPWDMNPGQRDAPVDHGGEGLALPLLPVVPEVQPDRRNFY